MAAECCSSCEYQRTVGYPSTSWASCSSSSLLITSSYYILNVLSFPDRLFIIGELMLLLSGVRLHTPECWGVAESWEEETWFRSWHADWEAHSRRKHCSCRDHMWPATAGNISNVSLVSLKSSVDQHWSWCMELYQRHFLIKWLEMVVGNHFRTRWQLV